MNEIDRLMLEYCAIGDSLADWVANPPHEPPDWPDRTWAVFAQVCAVHGVAPALHVLLGERSEWPEPARAWLGYQYQRNLERVSRIMKRLTSILAAFEEQGVAAIPFKGFAVIDLLYDDPGMRPMNDVDLLIKPENLEIAERLLLQLGYEKVFTGWKHVKFLLPGNHEIVDMECEHPDNPSPIEVHPYCRERIQEQVVDLTELVWDTARLRRFLGAKTWMMDLEVLWLYLLVHATHHIFSNNFRLVQLWDLARLRSKLGPASELLETVDARATIAPLALLQKYYPDRETGEMLRAQRQRTSKTFASWAESLDLTLTSHLNPTPWRV